MTAQRVDVVCGHCLATVRAERLPQAGLFRLDDHHVALRPRNSWCAGADTDRGHTLAPAEVLR